MLVCYGRRWQRRTQSSWASAPRPAAPRGAKRPARGPQGALRVRVAKKPKQPEGAEAGDAGGGLLGLGGYGESGSESESAGGAG